MRSHLIANGFAVLVASVAACADPGAPSPTNVGRGGSLTAPRSTTSTMVDPSGAVMDTILPMQRELAGASRVETLTDDELERRVTRTGRRAIIGLKPSQAEKSERTGTISGMSRAQILEARSMLRTAGIHILHGFRSLPLALVNVPLGSMKQLRALSIVDYVADDVSGRPAQSPPAQQQGWHIARTHADYGWSQFNNTGQRANIVLLDTGLDSTHLFNQALDGPEGIGTDCLYFATVGNSCFDEYNHGTGTAAIMSARNNSYGMIGVAYVPGSFASLRVCDDVGSCPTSTIIAGLDWARTRGLPRQIVNVSIGLCEPPRDCRRLQFLRGWSHGKDHTICARGPRAGCPDAVGA